MSFELTILGSGSAVPTSKRYPTAQVLRVPGRLFLIDCGEGTQIQLRRSKISFARIRHVFISHLHGDHYYGLIGFISTRNLLGINSDLHIWAHSDLKELLQPQLNYLKAELLFKVIFHPLNFKKTELVFSDKKTEVFSFPLKHSIPVCGFLFRQKPALPNMRKEKILQYQIPLRQIQGIKEGNSFTTPEGLIIGHSELTTPAPLPVSYAFCTDTAYYEELAGIVKDVTLLYHEATFLSDLSDWAAKTLHSTAAQAATIALKANARKLLIGHFSGRYKDENAFLVEAQAIFPKTFIADDGKTILINH